MPPDTWLIGFGFWDNLSLNRLSFNCSCLGRRLDRTHAGPPGLGCTGGDHLTVHVRDFRGNSGTGHRSDGFHNSLEENLGLGEDSLDAALDTGQVFTEEPAPALLAEVLLHAAGIAGSLVVGGEEGFLFTGQESPEAVVVLFHHGVGRGPAVEVYGRPQYTVDPALEGQAPDLPGPRIGGYTLGLVHLRQSGAKLVGYADDRIDIHLRIQLEEVLQGVVGALLDPPMLPHDLDGFQAGHPGGLQPLGLYLLGLGNSDESPPIGQPTQLHLIRFYAGGFHCSPGSLGPGPAGENLIAHLGGRHQAQLGGFNGLHHRFDDHIALSISAQHDVV